MKNEKAKQYINKKKHRLKNITNSTAESLYCIHRSKILYYSVYNYTVCEKLLTDINTTLGSTER